MAVMLFGSIFSSAPAEAQPDTSLFSTLAQYVMRSGLRHQPNDQKLRVDPRMVRISHGSYVLQDADLIDLSDERRGRRVEALERLNIPLTDILEDYKCFGSGGLQLPRETIAKLDSTADLPRESEESQRCKEKGFFISVIFSRPRAADLRDCSSDPAAQKENKRSACYSVRAIEITSYSFSEYDVFLHRTPGGKWTVMRKELVDGIAS